MFPPTFKGQKPVDMFLADLKTVDMFLEPKVRTGRTVDMFLTTILRTGAKNDYLFHFLVLTWSAGNAVRGIRRRGHPGRSRLLCRIAVPGTNVWVPTCPAEKEEAIMDAFRHFHMI
jgi:hypothetical protein